MNIINYTEEHKQFRQRIRTFLQNEVAPQVDQWDKDKIIPKSEWKRMGQAGCLCPSIAKKYGGPGGNFLHSVIVAEEMLRTGHMGTGQISHNDIIVPYIESYACEELKKKYQNGSLNDNTDDFLTFVVANRLFNLNKNASFWVLGESRTGKTLTVLYLTWKWSKLFKTKMDMDHVTIDLNHISELMYDEPEYSPIVLDDAGVEFSQYDWLKFKDKTMTKDMETMGYKKQIFFMICQHPKTQNINAGRLLNYRMVMKENYGYGRFKLYKMEKDMMSSRDNDDRNKRLTLNGNPVAIYTIPKFPTDISGKIDISKVFGDDKEFAKFYNEYEFTIKPRRLKEYKINSNNTEEMKERGSM